jgi:transcriptional regulator with XRE-family HTH domain
MPTAHDLPDPVAFAERLNRVLRARGYVGHGASLRLAKEYGVRAPTVSGWRSGRYLPALGKVKRMAKAWNVPEAWLYWNEGPEPDLSVLNVRAVPKVDGAATTEDDVEATKFAIGALASVMSSVRPREATELASAIRTQLKRPENATLARNDFLAALLSIFDSAASARSKDR